MILSIQPTKKIHPWRVVRSIAVSGALVVSTLLLVNYPSSVASASSKPSVIIAVGAENEYANVLSQIGGKYVAVSSILNNPNTDPHTFEASTSVAEEVSKALLIVQNGVGYDGFMNKIEAASPEFEEESDRSPERAGAPEQHAQPTSLVQPKDDASGGECHGQGPRSARSEPQVVFPEESSNLRRIAAALASRPSLRSRQSTPARQWR